MKHQDTTDHLFPFQQGVQRETWGRLPVLLSCRRGEESCLGTGYLPQSLPSPSPGCKLELPGAPSSPASWQRLPSLRSSARATSSVARQHPASGPAVPSPSPCQRLSCPAGGHKRFQQQWSAGLRNNANCKDLSYCCLTIKKHGRIRILLLPWEAILKLWTSCAVAIQCFQGPNSGPPQANKTA